MENLKEQIQRFQEISEKSDDKKVVRYSARLSTILGEINKKDILQEGRESLSLISEEILTEYRMKKSGDVL